MIGGGRGEGESGVSYVITSDAFDYDLYEEIQEELIG